LLALLVAQQAQMYHLRREIELLSATILLCLRAVSSSPRFVDYQCVAGEAEADLACRVELLEPTIRQLELAAQQRASELAARGESR
jgi:hypothetical protein